MYRIAAAHWPQPIVEQVYPDGRVTLRESLPVPGDEGMVRSRPLNAARIELRDGTLVLGYLVGLRAGDEESRNPPSGTVWRPADEDCELGFKTADRTLEWISCSAVMEVSRPNRMHLIALARLAFSRAVPGLAGYLS